MRYDGMNCVKRIKSVIDKTNIKTIFVSIILLLIVCTPITANISDAAPDAEQGVSQNTDIGNSQNVGQAADVGNGQDVGQAVDVGNGQDVGQAFDVGNGQGGGQGDEIDNSQNAGQAADIGNSQNAGQDGDDELTDSDVSGKDVFTISLERLSNVFYNGVKGQIEKKRWDEELAEAIEEAKEAALKDYNAIAAVRDAFAKAHGGKQVSEMSDDELNRAFNNDYFVGRMEALGYYSSKETNKSINSRNAIIRAQSRHNIPITAKIDSLTKRLLVENSDTISVDYVPEDHYEGMWVIINKETRILTVYVGDKVFKKFPVAVGKPMSLTPSGKWEFVNKYVNPTWGGGGYAAPIAGGARNNPLGKRWIGISKNGGSRYGVHGNASPTSIGTFASHGCVRMINEDVEELFEDIEIVTPLWIGTTAELKDWGVIQATEVIELVMPDFRDYLPEKYRKYVGLEDNEEFEGIDGAEGDEGAENSEDLNASGETAKDGESGTSSTAGATGSAGTSDGATGTSGSTGAAGANGSSGSAVNSGAATSGTTSTGTADTSGANGANGAATATSAAGGASGTNATTGAADAIDATSASGADDGGGNGADNGNGANGVDSAENTDVYDSNSASEGLSGDSSNGDGFVVDGDATSSDAYDDADATDAYDSYDDSYGDSNGDSYGDSYDDSYDDSYGDSNDDSYGDSYDDSDRSDATSESTEFDAYTAYDFSEEFASADAFAISPKPAKYTPDHYSMMIEPLRGTNWTYA